MADDLKDTGGQDRSRVNVNQPHELEYWSRKWGVTPSQLREAVERAGPMASAVARALGKSV